jgi:uridylate kinase
VRYLRKAALKYCRGTNHFTTDSAAALRALKLRLTSSSATKVDGVYTADPMADSSAERFVKSLTKAYLKSS